MEVKLRGEEAEELSLSFLERTSQGGQADDDREVVVGLRSAKRNFEVAATAQYWIRAADWASFEVSLGALEGERQGDATLVSASPDELVLTLYTVDALGHMALRGQLVRLGGREPSRIAFGFSFDAGLLRSLCDDLRAAWRSPD